LIPFHFGPWSWLGSTWRNFVFVFGFVIVFLFLIIDWIDIGSEVKI